MSVVVAGFIGVLVTVGLAALVYSSASLAAHTAHNAADSAALAAAERIQLGDQPAAACTTASVVAAAGGATLAGCEVAADDSVTVQLSVPVSLGPWGSRSAVALARAGPVSLAD